MAEWQILKPSETVVQTIGFVFAATKEEALDTAFRKFGIDNPIDRQGIVAIEVISSR